MTKIGAGEIIAIGILLLLLFGGKNLPEMGRGMGEAVKELKKSVRKEEKPKAKK